MLTKCAPVIRAPCLRLVRIATPYRNASRKSPKRRLHLHEVGEQQNQNEANKAPSLIEQLFPEESQRFEDSESRHAREVPRLPLGVRVGPPATSSVTRQRNNQSTSSRLARQAAIPKDTPVDHHNLSAVLRLENASKNLTIEDFRRIIPQGQHLEGWALEHGDIIGIIPGLELTRLTREPYYYLLFSSPFSASVYREHVQKVHALVRQHTPSAIHSAPPLPRGYILSGLDAPAVMAAYSILTPDQGLSLQQLKLPLTPHVEHIVRHGGFESLNRRPGRLPFELRMTLDGSQLSTSNLSNIFQETGRDMAVKWSGGPRTSPQISIWRAHARDLHRWLETRSRPNPNSNSADNHLPPVFILGFHTEHAAQTFMRYWHKRPLVGSKSMPTQIGDELPPIAELEMLW